MPRIRAIALVLLLATLALVLSSCSSSTGSTASFTIDVPLGSTAHATLQASDGHVLKTATLSASGTVTFDGAPSDSLVTVSMQAQTGSSSSTPTQDYASLTVPTSLAANHDFFMLPTVSGANVTVSGACPSNATSTTSILVYEGGGTAAAPATCTGTAPNLTFSTTLGVDPGNVAADGTVSLALLASNGGTAVATAGLLNQAFPNNAIAVAASDWTTSAPASNSATLQFPALPANQSATANFGVAALEQGLPVPVQNEAGATAGTGATSASMSAAYAPIAAPSYLVNESFKNTFNNGSLNWSSTSTRQHSVTSLPVNETVDTQTDLWPLLQSFSWSSSGSVTVAYGANAGTKAATFRSALVGVNDTATHTSKAWEFLDAPTPATPGTLAFPELPASMSAYVPTPVASANGNNSAELFFTDGKVPMTGLAALGILTPFTFFGPPTTGTGNVHTLQASTNAPLNPASVGNGASVPLIGLR
jgi:hypothetical protein